MKHVSIALVLFFGGITFAADDWFGCIESKIRAECEECFKSKSPADTMKFFEELTIPYQKRNEIREKSGSLQSMELVKSPGSETGEEVHYFFKDKKKCESECSKRRAAYVKESEDRKAKEDKKFEEYK